MSDPSSTTPSWSAWRAAPSSGFEVSAPGGEVGLTQIDATQFLVTKPFRFSSNGVEKLLVDRLVRAGNSEAQARDHVDKARTFVPTLENPTDLASIPQYMRWFESSYGLHTLAAILHDELIVGKPNGGQLGSDTLSDRFFREMMRAAGVPWLKRWIMWAAVALRTRWAAKGIRRVSVVAWTILALVGLTSFVWAAGSALLGWGHPLDPWVLLAIAVLLPFAAAPLWGKQYGGGLVAAIAGAWILPAAVFGGLGYVVYALLERLAKAVGLS
jgi:hypothetical protein